MRCDGTTPIPPVTFGRSRTTSPSTSIWPSPTSARPGCAPRASSFSRTSPSPISRSRTFCSAASKPAASPTPSAGWRTRWTSPTSNSSSSRTCSTGSTSSTRWGGSPRERAPEFILLLLNKLIFAKTLEDFGLVPYRFIQDEYALKKDRWEAKRAANVVRHFLVEFEECFDEYYDTEIFSQRIWGKLVPEEPDCARFCEKLEFMLGLDPWNTAMGCGVVNHNYRRIDEDIFGKSYEIFLAADREDEGICYTPAGITTPMADSLDQSLAGELVDQGCAAVDVKTCDFARADTLLAQLAELRIAHTTCGSGGFLIKVLLAFWRHYERIDRVCAWVQKILRPDNGEMFLAELPPNVEAALAFRRRHGFDQRQWLISNRVLAHVLAPSSGSLRAGNVRYRLVQAAIRLQPDLFRFKLLREPERLIQSLADFSISKNKSAVPSQKDTSIENSATLQP